MILILIRTFIFYLLTGLAIFVGFIPIVITALLPARWRYDNCICLFFSNLIYRAMVYGSCVPIKIRGTEHIPDGPVIYAANHQSSLDIPIVGIIVNYKPHIWFFKHEFAKLPLIGWIPARLSVAVDRTTPRRALKTLSEGIDLLEDKNRSLVIFPEGGRYIDGKIHDFLWGFAIIAKKIKRPVVPIYIDQAYKVYPPGSILVHYAPIHVVVGKAFEFKPGESDESFIQRVHSWFVEQAAK